MHPAYSVILFTTASGAGYGLLMLLAIGGLTGLVPVEHSVGVVGLALALALITIGLLSSMLLLGRPERAWRAFSQWRTSWLSREGVMALATYVPAALLAYGWIVEGEVWPLPALYAFAGALLTVWCTGMIYQSLPTIRSWAQPLTSPVYVALALATGGVVLVAIVVACGLLPRLTPWLAIGPLGAAWLLKVRAWHVTDTAPRTYTIGSATGLDRASATATGTTTTVSPLDSPHSQANYVMREMGFTVARRHAQRLRELAAITLFAVPLAMMLVVLGLQTGWIVWLASALAVVSAAIGVLTERWLFFAEATHVVTLYYGQQAA